jgi:DNA-binding response OmpR family regulator
MLVIDDQRNLLTALRIVIGGEHEVSTAATVAEALPLLRGARFDAVVCDAHMVANDAESFVASLSPEHARVVFTTDGGHDEDERILGRVHLTKPFTERELLDAIQATAPR